MKDLLQFFTFLIIAYKTMGAVEVIYARVGDNIDLNLKQLPQTFYVRWFLDKDNGHELASINHVGGKSIDPGDIWSGRLSITPNILTIKNIRDEDFRTFVCRMSDNSNTHNSKKFILIKVNVSMNEAQPLVPGDDLSLNCNLTTEWKPAIYWKNPTGRNLSISSLVRKKAESQDNGEWTCVVTNNGKQNMFRFSVSVVDFSSTSKSLYTSTNLPLTVPFVISPNDFMKQILSKIENVEWVFIPKTSFIQKTIFSISLRNGQLKNLDPHRGLRCENFTTHGNFSLHKKLSREEDRGTYNCSITFNNGFILSRTVHVEVLQIIPSPATELISGYHLNLSCSTGGPLDTNVKVKWFPPKTSSLANTKLTSGHLIIQKVSTEDSGRWRCELGLEPGPGQNRSTLTSAVIALKIEPVLTVWMLVTICGAAVILILLLILAFILFRRRQRKMRQLRHRLCQCKNPKPKGFYKA
ncbi:T-cell surface glycoprotein CD4-like [Girardinichthys multiradiatus]|uniref:T-cell surface glycoprotein CD4-like n=1 Tax=Girardinichthys multiradiatus TaxID=208333 RepID=UPI001FAC31E8|nr:T-cell surface glycoprotein CD4-like [Girardinichthys multiradiatus]